MTEKLLILLVFFPLIGAAIIGALSESRKDLSKQIALWVSMVPFILSLFVYFDYTAMVKAGKILTDPAGYVISD